MKQLIYKTNSTIAKLAILAVTILLEYVTAIVKTVAAYIGLEPVLVYKDDSNEPESLINYGVRRKSKKVDASASNEESPNVIQ